MCCVLVGGKWWCLGYLVFCEWWICGEIMFDVVEDCVGYFVVIVVVVELVFFVWVVDECGFDED